MVLVWELWEVDMADTFEIFRVTDFKFGARNKYPHNGGVSYLSPGSAISEAERLNEGRRDKHQDFYVVFKNGVPYWSPEEDVVLKVSKMG